MPTLRPIIATTNSTKAVGGQDKKQDDFLVYVLIVVGATIFLLLIPLASFIFKVYRRKRKRKLIERRRQLLKNQPMNGVDGHDQNHLNGYGGAFHIAPKNTIKPLPRSPIRKDPPDERITKIEEQDEPDFAEFQKENGLINKGFHTSNNMISIHMRRSTTDLYLPSDNSLLTVAKRRYSEDLDMKSKSFLEANFAASLPSQNKPKESTEKDDSAKGDSSPDGTVTKSENSDVRNQQDDADSSDSDDYDDVYENVHREETATDSDSSHIYDNIDNLTPRSSVDDVSDSDSEHIYSNIDDLSESDGSHIYTNLEELSEEATTLSEDDDIYENVRFRARKNSCNTETTSGDDSDSITYENTDFLNDSEVFDGTESDDKSTRPIIIPRIPARQKPRLEPKTAGQISPRRRNEQNGVNKQPRDQPSTPRDRGSNPQASGNNSRETRTKPEARSENIQTRSKFQANGTKSQQRGNKAQQKGNNLQQNGKKPQVRGNNLQVRGTKPQIKGTKPQERGKRAQIRGQNPQGLRQGVKKDGGALREFKTQPRVAQNKIKVASNQKTYVNRKRIDSEKFV